MDVSPPNVDRAVQDGEAALHNIRIIVTALASNIFAASNSLLGDALDLCRHVLADTADELADRSHQTASALRDTADLKEPNASEDVSYELAQGEIDNLKHTLAQNATAFGRATNEALGREKTFRGIASDDAETVLASRLHTIVERIRSDPDVSSAVLGLLDTAHRYLTAAEELTVAAHESMNEVEADAHLVDPDDHAAKGMAALAGLIESLSGHGTEKIFECVRSFAAQGRSDPALASYLRDVRSFVSQAISSDEALNIDDSREHIDRLIIRGQDLIREESAWKTPLIELKQEIIAILHAMQRDPDLCAIRQAADGLSSDLAGFSKQAVWTLEGEVGDLWRDVVNVVLPRILRYITHLSVPRTEVATPYVDVVVDDLRLANVILLPSTAKLSQRADVSYERGLGEQDSELHLAHATGTLQLAGLSFSCAGVSLAMTRKFCRWLPYMRRFSTLAELRLPLPGIETRLAYTRLGTTDADGHLTRLDKLAVRLPTFAIVLRHSSHPVLSFLLGRLATPIARYVFRRLLEQHFRQLYEGVDSWLYQVSDDAQRRGGGLASWIAAASASFEATDHAEESESSDPDSETDSHKLLDGVHATNVGVVKDIPDSSIRVAVGGAPQVVDGDVRGPGYDTFTDVVEDARKAVPAVSVPQIRDLTGRLASGIQRADAERQRNRRQDSRLDWRSEAFDLIRHV